MSNIIIIWTIYQLAWYAHSKDFFGYFWYLSSYSFVIHRIRPTLYFSRFPDFLGYFPGIKGNPGIPGIPDDPKTLFPHFFCMIVQKT